MRYPAAILSALALSGCASVEFGHTDPGLQPGSARQAPLVATGAAQPAIASHTAAPGGHALQDSPFAVRAVVLKFTPQARQQLAADERFDADALRAAIEDQLRSHGLLQAAGSPAGHDLQVTLDGFRLSPAANAVVLGYVFSNAMLTGQAALLEQTAGARPGPFEISARARLTEKGRAGSDGHALAGMYRRFALLTVDALRGVETPPEPLPR